MADAAVARALETEPSGRADAPATARRPGGLRLRARIPLWVCCGWLALVVLCAVLAAVLPLEPFDEPVGSARQGLSWSSEPLGTDELGRSVLSRVVYGARVSLAVGFMAVGIGGVVGTAIGVVAGYFRGWIDAVVGAIVDSALAFPPLVLLLAISAMSSPSVPTLSVGLAILTIPTFARLARASSMAFAEREFVAAARTMGASHWRVLTREILPNVALPVLSFTFLLFGVVIVAEGSLSFLSLGIPPPNPSWGGMISSGRNFLETDPHLVFVPAGFLLMTVLSFNVIGERVRSRFEGPSVLS